jgi:benzoyl-CoA reductase subunit B
MICRYIDEYQADGLLINSIKSCNSFSAGQLLMMREVEKRTGKPAAFIETDLVDPRYFSAGQLLMMREVEKRTGKPAAFVESDLVDPRYFSAANIKNRLESYFQMIDQKRAGANAAA